MNTRIWYRLSVLTSLLAMIFTSCDHGPTGRSDSALKNIFGTDDRSPVTSTAAPWASIGRLSNGCTGTLVARDIVLTAAHCIYDNAASGPQNPLPTFAPNYMNGGSKDEGIATEWWVGTTDWATYPAHDWALIKLDQYLGDIYGWMGTKTIAFSGALPYTISLAGYSADFENGLTAAAHIGCKIRQATQNNTYLYHDCDTTRGSSGGPLFAMWENQAYVVGVNTAENRDGGEESLRLGSYDGTHPNSGVWQVAIVNKILEWSKQADPSYLSLWWTNTGSRWGIGVGTDETEAERLANTNCADAACVKAFTVANSCFALSSDEHGSLSFSHGSGRKNNEARAIEACSNSSTYRSECHIVASECQH